MECYTKINYDNSKFDLKRKKMDYVLYLKGVKKPIFTYNDVENLELNQINCFDDTYFVSIDGPSKNKSLLVIKVSKDGKIIDRVDKKAMDIKSITRDIYLLNNLDWGYELYYVNDNRSFKFDKVYNVETSRNLIEGTPLLVEEKYTYPYNEDIYDIITYGICPTTKEVVTKIYSRLQKKYISVPGWVKLDKGLDSIISNEVIKPLYDKGDHIPLDDSVLDKTGRVNKEFVMTLGKKR